MCDEAKIMKNAAQDCSDGMSRRLSRFRNGISRRDDLEDWPNAGACLRSLLLWGVVQLWRLESGNGIQGGVFWKRNFARCQVLVRNNVHDPSASKPSLHRVLRGLWAEHQIFVQATTTHSHEKIELPCIAPLEEL